VWVVANGNELHHRGSEQNYPTVDQTQSSLKVHRGWDERWCKIKKEHEAGLNSEDHTVDLNRQRENKGEREAVSLKAKERRESCPDFFV